MTPILPKNDGRGGERRETPPTRQNSHKEVLIRFSYNMALWDLNESFSNL